MRGYDRSITLLQRSLEMKDSKEERGQARLTPSITLRFYSLYPLGGTIFVLKLILDLSSLFFHFAFYLLCLTLGDC